MCMNGFETMDVLKKRVFDQKLPYACEMSQAIDTCLSTIDVSVCRLAKERKPERGYICRVWRGFARQYLTNLDNYLSSMFAKQLLYLLKIKFHKCEIKVHEYREMKNAMKDSKDVQLQKKSKNVKAKLALLLKRMYKFRGDVLFNRNI